MDPREIKWGCMDWIYLAQDRDRRRALVNTVMILRVLVPTSDPEMGTSSIDWAELSRLPT
jgi:hypothetical protein